MACLSLQDGEGYGKHLFACSLYKFKFCGNFYFIVFRCLVESFGMPEVQSSVFLPVAHIFVFVV